MSGALQNVVVLDLSTGMAGALTSMLLADNGASVIKVQPPSGDPLESSAYYKVWNRGKKSVALDIERPRGAGILKGLAAKADVLLETFQPGKMRKLGVDYASLRDSHPRLVYTSLTGYGQEGSEKDRPAYDALVQARTGLMWDWVQGLYSEPHLRTGPLYLGFAFPSAAAAYSTTLGILAALTARERTGRGQHVDASLLSGTLIMSRWAWAKGMADPASDPPGERGRLWFQTKDGVYFYIHTGARGSAERLVAALGFDDLLVTTNGAAPRVNLGEPKVRQRIIEAFGGMPWSQLEPLLDKADMPNRPTRHAGEALNDAHVKALGAVITVDDPELGRLTQVAPPARFRKTPSQVGGPAPSFGQHTDEVLVAAGISQAEIAKLRSESTIA